MATEPSTHVHKNLTSNFGRKYGEPKLVGDDFSLWSKYYHSSYGQPFGRPFYRDKYVQEASEFGTRQKKVLGHMEELKDILNRDRVKLKDYTALLEDQHDQLYRMNKDPYYECLLQKYPEYRDNQSYFPRRKEINERLAKLDEFYRQKREWARVNQVKEQSRAWIEEYIKKREADRKKPEETLARLKNFLDETGQKNEKIAGNYEDLTKSHSRLDGLIAKQKRSIEALRSRLEQTEEERRKKAYLLRHSYEMEADKLHDQIRHEKYLRQTLTPRISPVSGFYPWTRETHSAGSVETRQDPILPPPNYSRSYSDRRLLEAVRQMNQYSRRRFSHTPEYSGLSGPPGYSSKIMNANQQILDSLVDSHHWRTFLF